MKDYIYSIKHIFDYKTRTRRSGYWNTSFVITFVSTVSIFLWFLLSGGFIAKTDGFMKTQNGVAVAPKSMAGFWLGLLLMIILMILHILVSISLTIRRYHDAGFSGAMILIGIFGNMLCGIGGLVQFVICGFFDSKEDNKWGANPKSENPKSGVSSVLITALITFLLTGGLVVISTLLFNKMVAQMTGSFADTVNESETAPAEKEVNEDMNMDDMPNTTEPISEPVEDPIPDTETTATVENTFEKLEVFYQDMLDEAGEVVSVGFYVPSTFSIESTTSDKTILVEKADNDMAATITVTDARSSGILSTKKTITDMDLSGELERVQSPDMYSGSIGKKAQVGRLSSIYNKEIFLSEDASMSNIRYTHYVIVPEGNVCMSFVIDIMNIPTGLSDMEEDSLSWIATMVGAVSSSVTEEGSPVGNDLPEREEITEETYAGKSLFTAKNVGTITLASSYVYSSQSDDYILLVDSDNHKQFEFGCLGRTMEESKDGMFTTYGAESLIQQGDGYNIFYVSDYSGYKNSLLCYIDDGKGSVVLFSVSGDDTIQQLATELQAAMDSWE